MTGCNEVLEKALSRARRTKDNPEAASIGCLTPYSVPDSASIGVNQFVVLLKPEVLRVDEGVDVQAVLELLFDRGHTFGVCWGAVSFVPGCVMREQRCFEEQFSTLNRTANRGVSALLPSVLARLRQIMSREGVDDVDVLGGYQFLRRYSDWGLDSLELLCRSRSVEKLAAGVYATVAEVRSRRLIILNAFHPKQLEHFTQTSSSVLVLEGRAEMNWRALRAQFLGSLDPREASAESLRGGLYRRAQELGVKDVSVARNGFHLSPGPAEAVPAIRKFLRKSESGAAPEARETVLGHALWRRGWTEIMIEELSTMSIGRTPDEAVSVFELTEDLDLKESLHILISAVEGDQLYKGVGADMQRVDPTAERHIQAIEETGQ